jgi:hypothetical protein
VRWLALALVLAFAPGAGAAGIYQWTDSNGAIHFTDDPGKIPKKYHDTVQEVVRPPDEESESDGASSPEARPATKPRPEPAPDSDRASPPEAVDAHGHNRDWWQQRVQEWQDKKTEAQAKLADAQERLGRERFLNQTTGNAKRIQDISAEVSTYDAEILEAENMLTDGLPDEARKAQAPPGWLRE